MLDARCNGVNGALHDITKTADLISLVRSHVRYP